MSREEGWGISGEGAPGATNVSVNCFKKKKKTELICIIAQC